MSPTILADVKSLAGVKKKEAEQSSNFQMWLRLAKHQVKFQFLKQELKTDFFVLFKKYV